MLDTQFLEDHGCSITNMLKEQSWSRIDRPLVANSSSGSRRLDIAAIRCSMLEGTTNSGRFFGVTSGVTSVVKPKRRALTVLVTIFAAVARAA
jgi:hypothetical protein